MKTRIRLLVPLVLLGTLSATAATDPGFSVKTGGTVELSQTGGKFDFLRIDAKNHRLLASHKEDGTADIVDLKSAKLLKRIKVGEAVDMAVDQESKNYYVSVQEGKRVAVIDAESLLEKSSIPTPGPTDAIIFNPTNRMVYVTFDGGDAVWVIDPKAGKVTATIPVAGVPEFMVYDAKANRIYLNLKSKNVVAVIDPGSNKIVAQWATAPATAPHGLALDAANHQVLSAGGNGKLVAIDTATGTVTASADITAKVDQIAFDADTALVYCAGPDRMTVIRATAGKLAAAGSIATFPTARNVAVDPETQAVWTTYTDGKRSFATSWQPVKP